VWPSIGHKPSKNEFQIYRLFGQKNIVILNTKHFKVVGTYDFSLPLTAAFCLFQGVCRKSCGDSSG
jgi:hypothetical protein